MTRSFVRYGAFLPHSAFCPEATSTRRCESPFAVYAASWIALLSMSYFRWIVITVLAIPPQKNKDFQHVRTH